MIDDVLGAPKRIRVVTDVLRFRLNNTADHGSKFEARLAKVQNDEGEEGRFQVRRTGTSIESLTAKHSRSVGLKREVTPDAPTRWRHMPVLRTSGVLFSGFYRRAGPNGPETDKRPPLGGASSRVSGYVMPL